MVRELLTRRIDRRRLLSGGDGGRWVGRLR
jgi:hypothetical protein